MAQTLPTSITKRISITEMTTMIQMRKLSMNRESVSSCKDATRRMKTTSLMTRRRSRDAREKSLETKMRRKKRRTIRKWRG